MFAILFTRRGQKDIEKLPAHIQTRIKNKLLDYSVSDNPLSFAKPLIDLPPATHRFRVGKYRISFFVHEKTIFVERVELRGEAY